MTQNPNTQVFSVVPSSITNLPTQRYLISEPVRLWRTDITARLNELVKLERGWDGYRAGPVKFETASFALKLLEAACPSDAPAPSVVPGIYGDLQIEWHAPGLDIELHVKAPYDVVAFRARENHEEEEEPLSNDFTVVARWVREMMEQLGAPAAAAA